MKRAKRGDRPDPSVPSARFDTWSVERVARLLTEAGIDAAEVTAMRVRPMNGMYEWMVDTLSRGTITIGRDPVLEYAARYGDLADEYLAELAATLPLDRGRPPGIADITDDAKLREALAEMDRDRVKVTRETLASRAGYSFDALRGYLRRTNRSFADLLRELRQ